MSGKGISRIHAERYRITLFAHFKYVLVRAQKVPYGQFVDTAGNSTYILMFTSLYEL